MGRVSLKRRHYGFHKGHIFYPTTSKGQSQEYFKAAARGGYVRLPYSTYQELRNGDGQISDADGNICTNVHFLRPLYNMNSSLASDNVKEKGNSDQFESYRIWHARKVEHMFNDCYREHRTVSPQCQGDLALDPQGEVQRGLAWEERLMCRQCTYVSVKFKLYNILRSGGERGPKPADLNYMVQCGLGHTDMSTRGLRRTLLAMNVPAPSERHLQRTANVTGDKLIEENRKDINQIRQHIKTINQFKGLDPGAAINVEVDARYNNPVYSAGLSPFQPATQMCQIVCELSTHKKQVIGVNTKSKLCHVGRVWASKQKTQNPCPEHPGRCTASLKMDASIGM